MNKKKTIKYSNYKKEHNLEKITREDFMNFFRDDQKLNELTNDDRVEVFSTILSGSSNFSKDFLNEILSDYCVDSLEVIEV